MARGRGGEVEVKLRRDLGLLEIVMIGLGPTIGTTIFLLVGPGFAITGPSLILAFGLNFVVTMFTAMAYMELGSAFPETGGGYLWIRRSMRDPWGFLGGWLSWFGHMVVASFYIFGFGLGSVALLKVFLDVPVLQVNLFGLVLGEDALVKLLAVAAAATFIWLNYRGTKLTGRSETGVTLVLLVIVCIFIAAGLIHFVLTGGVPWQNFTPFFRGSSGWDQFVTLFAAMGFTFIVFEGYEIIAQTGEEVKNPERNIPRAHFIVIGGSTLIFILVAFVAVGLAGNCSPGQAACLVQAGAGGVVSGNTNAIAELAGLILPLGLPAIASLAIFQFLWTWNDLIVALTFGQNVQPITVWIFGQLRQFGTSIDVIAPASFISLVVPLCVFFAFQRYFVQGLLAGSVK